MGRLTSACRIDLLRETDLPLEKACVVELSRRRIKKITAPKEDQTCGLHVKASSTQGNCRPVWDRGIMNLCRYWEKKTNRKEE